MVELKKLEELAGGYICTDFRKYDETTQKFIRGLFNSIIVLDKDNFLGNYGLGVLELISENENAAIIHFNRCVKKAKSPLTPMAYKYLGMAYAKRRDYINASTQYTIALLFRKFELEEFIEDLEEKIKNIPEKFSKENEIIDFVKDDDLNNKTKKNIMSILDAKNKELDYIKAISSSIDDKIKECKYDDVCDIFSMYADRYLT